MKKKIKALTTEQIEKLAIYRDKWLEIGLSTDKVDRAAGESAIRAVYRAANFEEPKNIIWLPSPLAGAVYAHRLTQLPASIGGDQVGAQIRAQVRDQVEAQVEAQVWAQVWDQVIYQVRAQVRDQVGAQVWDQIWAQVRAQVIYQVRAQVRAQVEAQVRAQVRDQVSRCGYGQHDASWLSFYQYLLEVCGLSCCSTLKPMIDLAYNCGWWWPFQRSVILTERPTRLLRDKEHRLHNDQGRMAIEYADGFGVYACHGTRLPESYGKLPAAQWKAEWLLTEHNQELKRCIIQTIGYDKIAKELKAEALDSWSDDGRGGHYELVKIEDGIDVAPIVLLKMSCPSTGAPYMIRVPPEITNAYDAITWIRQGYKPEEFICQH